MNLWNNDWIFCGNRKLKKRKFGNNNVNLDICKILVFVSDMFLNFYEILKGQKNFGNLNDVMIM